MVPVTEFKNVTKRYGDVIAAHNINLDVASGEFFVFSRPFGVWENDLTANDCRVRPAH